MEKQVDRIAKGINGIDPKKLELINEANINAAKAPQTTTTAAAGGGAEQYLPAQTEELKKQATTYYPALLEQEKNLHKVRREALSDLEKYKTGLKATENAYQQVLGTLKLIDSLDLDYDEKVKSFNAEMERLNIPLRANDVNLQNLTSQLVDMRNAVTSSESAVAAIDKQIEIINKQIVETEAGMTKFQKVIARTGVVGRTAFNMLKTAIASVGIGLLITGVTAAVTAL